MGSNILSQCILGTLGPAPLGWGVAGPQEPRYGPSCTIPNLFALVKIILALAGITKSFRDAGHRPIGVGARYRNLVLLHLSCNANLGHSGQNWTSVTDIHKKSKSLILRIRILKVTQGHWNPHESIGSIWLHIVICSNHGADSYRFPDKRRFLWKIANFPTPVHLTPPQRSTPWISVTAVTASSRLCPYTRRWKDLVDICIRIDTIPVWIGQNDVFSITISRSACLGILMRDKKTMCLFNFPCSITWMYCRAFVTQCAQIITVFSKANKVLTESLYKVKRYNA